MGRITEMAFNISDRSLPQDLSFQKRQLMDDGVSGALIKVSIEWIAVGATFQK